MNPVKFRYVWRDYAAFNGLSPIIRANFCDDTAATSAGKTISTYVSNWISVLRGSPLVGGCESANPDSSEWLGFPLPNRNVGMRLHHRAA